MRLVVLAGSGSPWAYGALEAIAEAGADLTVVHVPPGPGQAYIDPADPRWVARRERLRGLAEQVLEPDIGAGPLRYLRLGRWLRGFLSARPDSGLLTLYGGGLALAGALSRHPRFAVYAVGSDVLGVSGQRALVSRWALHRSSRVFANGVALAEATRRLAPRAKVTPLLLGVDTNRFSPGNPSPAPVRFLCARGFQPVYNNQQILEAASLLPGNGFDWELVFAAGGELLPAAKEWASRNLRPDALPRVKFMGGLGQEELIQELRSSHVFVSMSRSDGAATSLLEALSCGLQPILSDIPANLPWVADGEQVPLDQPQALADAMQRLAQQASFGHEDRLARRKIVTESADSHLNMREMLRQLREDWGD